MDDEFDGLCAIHASGGLYLCAFLVCLAAFRMIVSFQQNREELRLWRHRLRHARLLRISRALRL